MLNCKAKVMHSANVWCIAKLLRCISVGCVCSAVVNVRQTLINKQCICTYTITNMMAEVCEIRYRVKESTIVHMGELSKKVGRNEIRMPLGQWKSM